MRTTLDLPDPPFRELKARVAVRSPLPIARRATGRAIRALNNAQIAKILDADDAAAE